MNQAVISYVLSKIARVADVHRSDINTSMLNGTITLKNATLRPETLNPLLPLPLEKGEVPFMEVKIPNPTTSAPLIVKIHDARLTFPLDLSSPPQDRNIEEILAGITDASVLGHHPDTRVQADDDTNRSSLLSSPKTTTAASSSPFSNSGTAAAESAASASPSDTESISESAYHDGTDGTHNDDDDDYLSCRSDGDISDTDSCASTSTTSSPTAAAAAYPGFFAYWKNKVTSSLLQREVRLELSSLTFILPCDTRKNIYYEIKVESFVVVIEPPQVVGEEQLKVVTITVKGIGVGAYDGTRGQVIPARVLVSEGVTAQITTVHMKDTEVVLRRNTAVTFGGITSIIADEATLFSFVKCKVTRDAMLMLPAYCRPFASLRSEPSLWHYVCCSVIQKVRDERRRYNFNLSYLRLYAQSRRQYMRLLEECHKAQSVAERRQELAELEQDVRYTDVILYMRQRVQRQFGLTLVSSALAVADSTKVVDAKPEQQMIFVSKHFEWDVVRIVLPARNCITVLDTSVVSRNNETVAIVGNIILTSGDETQSLKRSMPAGGVGNGEEDPLFMMRAEETPTHCEKTVNVHSLACALRSSDALAVVHPLVNVLRDMLANERPIAARGSDNALPLPEAENTTACVDTRTKTFILTIPSVSVRLDELLLTVDRCSITCVAAPTEALPKLGCVLKEFSIRTQDGFLVMPIEATMLDSGNHIIVSEVFVHVDNHLWEYTRGLRDDLRKVIDAIPPQVLLLLSSTESSTSGSASAVASDLTRLRGVMKDAVFHLFHGAQHILCRGVHFTFDPLNVSLTLSSIVVAPVSLQLQPKKQREQANKGSKFFRVSIGSILLNSAHTANAVLKLEMAEGVQMCEGTSGGARAEVMSVHIPGLVCSLVLRDALGSKTRQVELLRGTSMRIGAYRGLTLMSVAEVVLCGGVHFEPVQGLIKEDASSVPTTERPFRSSFVQASVTSRRVDVSKLAGAPFGVIESVALDLWSFVREELMATNAYKLFFSAYADIAVSLQTDSCAIECGGVCAPLYLSLDHAPLTHAQLPPLATFEPLLMDSLTNHGPILLLTRLEQLAMSAQISGIRLSLGTTAMPGPYAQFVAELVGVTAQLPIGANDFWNHELKLQPAVPTQVSLQCLELSALATPTDSTTATKVLRVTAEGLSVEAGELRTVRLPSLAEGTFSATDSERGSCPSTSTTEEEPTCTVVSLQTWTCVMDFALPLATYARVMEIVSSCNAIFYSALQCSVCVSDSVVNQCFDLDSVGDVHFCCHDDVTIANRCTFSSTSLQRCVVVHERTAVVFRNCTFRYPSVSAASSFVRLCGPTAACVFEDCNYIAPDAPDTSAGVTRPARPISRLSVVMESGLLRLHLLSDAKVTLFHRRVNLSYNVDTGRHRSGRLRLEEVRMEYVEGPNSTIVCPKLSAELGASVNERGGSCSLNCFLSASEITIPLAVDAFTAPVVVATFCRNTLEQMAISHSELILSAPPTAPQLHQRGFCLGRLPLSKWKVLVSLSLVPVSVTLPNHLPVGRFTVSNAFFWSTKERTAEVAAVEARLALHNGSLWEFTSQAFVPVLLKPLLFGLQGRLLSPRHATIECTLSESDAVISVEQMRLLSTLATHVFAHSTNTGRSAASADNVLRGTALEIVNQSGVAVQFQSTSGDTITAAARGDRVGASSCLRLPAYVLDMPYALNLADGQPVDHTELTVLNLPTYCLNESLAASASVVVLANQARLHVETSIAVDLTQRIVVRSTMHVKNESRFVVTLLPTIASGLHSEEAWTIDPETISCVPYTLLQGKGPLKLVASAETEVGGARGTYSSSTPLWSGGGATPHQFCEMLHAQGCGARSISGLRCVRDTDGEAVFLDVSFELMGSVVIMFIAPSVPAIRNETELKQMRLRVFDAKGTVVRDHGLVPGAVAEHMYTADPTSQYTCELSVALNTTDQYTATERVDLSACYDGGSIVMRHVDQPHLCFEINTVPSCSEGSRVRVASVVAEHLCLLCNSTGEAVTAFAEGSTASSVLGLGTTGSTGTVSVEGVYLPLRIPLTLRVRGMTSCDSLELSPGDEQAQRSVIECGEEVAYCVSVLARSQKRAGGVACVELLPTIIFVNEARVGLLRVQHNIRRCTLKSSVSLEAPLYEDVICVSTTPSGGAASSASCCVLAREGFSNTFAFSFNGCGYSFPVTTDLAPGTNWCAYMQCGPTYHRVSISKRGLCDPAVISVSAPLSPFVRLINMTSGTFEEVGPMQLRLSAPPIREHTEVQLTRRGANAGSYRICATRNTVIEVEPDILVSTRVDKDYCTIVVHEKRRNGSFPCDMQWRRTDTEDGEQPDAVAQCRCIIQVSRTSLRVREDRLIPLQFLLESLALDFTATSGSTSAHSAQCTATGVSLWSMYEGKRVSVVAPSGFDFTLRDASLSPTCVRIASFYLNFTPLCITVSDVLLYQCAHLSSRCSIPNRRDATPLSAIEEALQTSLAPRRVFVESAILSEVEIELSWDRSVTPPKTYVLLMPLIPSLYHAAIKLPKLQLKKVSCESPQQLGIHLRQVILVELLKQIPRIVGSVGLFKKNFSFAQKVSSALASFVFGSKTEGPLPSYDGALI